MAYENGKITISAVREYTVICADCDTELVDFQRVKSKAEKIFRKAGWKKRKGKCCCPTHSQVAGG